MTLLQICKDVADEVSISRPTTIATSTSPDVQKLFRLANRVGIRLMQAYAWQELRAEKTFTGLGQETQTAILPADFDRIVTETFWNRSASQLITGPVSAVEWQSLKANSYSDSTRRKFAYRGGAILVFPLLAGGESLAFEYVSENWALSNASVAQPRFLADTDTSLIDEELITLGTIFEYLDGEGQPSQRAFVEYEDRFNVLSGNDQPTSGVMLSGDIFGGHSRHFSGQPGVKGRSI